MNTFKGTPANWQLTTIPFELMSNDDAATVYGPREKDGGACLIARISRSPGDNEALANAKVIAAAPSMMEALQAIVEDAETKIQASIRAADRHNNTPGVGIDFDYMSVPPPPKWLANAKAALSAALD